MEEYIGKITPLLDDIVCALVKQRPDDPVSFLLDFLGKRKQLSGFTNTDSANPISPPVSVVGVVHQPGHHVSEFPFVSSPTSQGLLSPTHSPSNVARYLGQGQRISIPAESTGDIMRRFGEEEEMNLFSKTEEEKHYIFNLFRNCLLFSDKLESDLIPVFDAMEKREFNEPDSDVLIDNSVLFIGSGGIEIEKICKGELELEIKGPGDVIGELGNVCDEYQKIVTTDPNTIIWKINREYFDYLVRLCSQRRRERLATLLASVPILSSLDTDQHRKISDAVKHAHFKNGEIIVSKEDTAGGVLYIVESGNCTVIGEDAFEDNQHYGPGDYFGELSIGSRTGKTVTAASDNVSVLLLDRESFKRLLGPVEDLLVPDYGEI